MALLTLSFVSRSSPVCDMYQARSHRGQRGQLPPLFVKVKKKLKLCFIHKYIIIHKNAQNTQRVFDFINYFQKHIKNSSEIKKFPL